MKDNLMIFTDFPRFIAWRCAGSCAGHHGPPFNARNTAGLRAKTRCKRRARFFRTSSLEPTVRIASGVADERLLPLGGITAAAGAWTPASTGGYNAAPRICTA